MGEFEYIKLGARIELPLLCVCIYLLQYVRGRLAGKDTCFSLSDPPTQHCGAFPSLAANTCSGASTNIIWARINHTICK